MNFVFAIPFRAKSTAGNWDLVCTLLDATIRSCLACYKDGVRIIICGHDLPDSKHMKHPAVTFLTADHSPPPFG